MQEALAERRGVAVPLTEEDPRRLRPVDRPTRRQERRPLLRRPTVLLLLFAVCLAFLGVSRVTLTFAVVQKSLETESLIEQQRTVRQDNAELTRRLARLNAATRVHNLAVGKLGLVAPASIVYLPAGKTTAGQTAAGTGGEDAATTSATAGASSATTGASAGSP